MATRHELIGGMLVLAVSAGAWLLPAVGSVRADEPASDEEAPEEPAPEEQDPEQEPEIVQVAPNRHLQVEARSLRLTEQAAARLLRIAARYHERTRRPLVITGGDRGAEHQAALMYKKLENGENLMKLYARDDLVRPIVAAYRAGKDSRRSRRSIVRAMTAVIAEQMANKEFVSRHLDFTAADVRSRDMSKAQLEAFREAVAAEPEVVLIDERKSAAPCFHLTL